VPSFSPAAVVAVEVLDELEVVVVGRETVGTARELRLGLELVLALVAAGEAAAPAAGEAAAPAAGELLGVLGATLTVGVAEVRLVAVGALATGTVVLIALDGVAALCASTASAPLLAPRPAR
jgi:hypothetical protein